MKKKIILCLSLFFAIWGLTACGFNANNKSAKELINEFVVKNQAEIKEQIENSSEKELSGLEGFSGIPELGNFVSINDLRIYDKKQKKYLKKGFVYFECESSGMVSSSVQSGFYYSAEDVHSKDILWATVSDDWKEIPCENENSWYYTDGSDNFLETSKICDNFYYFQIGC